MNKLQSVLNDEESMKQIRELADMLSGQGEGSAPQTGGTPNALPQADLPNLSALSPSDSTENTGMPDIASLIKLGSIAKNACANDKNIALLLALKPLLKDENKHKVDRAVKLLRLMNIYPALKESGLNGGDLFGLLG